MRPKFIYLLCCTTALPAALALFHLLRPASEGAGRMARERRSTEPAALAVSMLSPERDPSRVLPTAPEKSQLQTQKKTTQPSPNAEELLNELRELQLSDPERTLLLVRRGEQLLGADDTAPERAWFEARALVELQQFDEARHVAKTMVEEYPDATFTQDLRRHLLSNPFGLPPRER